MRQENTATALAFWRPYANSNFAVPDYQWSIITRRCRRKGHYAMSVCPSVCLCLSRQEICAPPVWSRVGGGVLLSCRYSWAEPGGRGCSCSPCPYICLSTALISNLKKMQSSLTRRRRTHQIWLLTEVYRNVRKILSPSSSLPLLAKTITHPAARSLCDSWASCLFLKDNVPAVA